MNIKDFFVKQFAFNDKMNFIMVDKLKELENPPHEAHALMSHITQAQILWLDRLYGNTGSVRQYYKVLSIPEMEDKLRSNHEGWLSFMNEYDENGLNEIFTYKNVKGEEFSNNLYDIVFHIINHSTHHRAQVSKILRQHDIAPPVMDYIVFAREN
jgi:uncharacterized damage-inducible protein DinB